MRISVSSHFSPVTVSRRYVLAIALGVLVSVALAGIARGSMNRARAEDPPSIVEAAALLHPDLGYDSQAILADGKVTKEEYVAAVLAARDCSLAEGLRVTEARWEPSGRFIYELGGYDTRAELTEHSPAFNRCNEAFMSGIAMVYENSLPQNQYHLPTE